MRRPQSTPSAAAANRAATTLLTLAALTAAVAGAQAGVAATPVEARPVLAESPRVRAMVAAVAAAARDLLAAERPTVRAAMIGVGATDPPSLPNAHPAPDLDRLACPGRRVGLSRLNLPPPTC